MAKDKEVDKKDWTMTELKVIKNDEVIDKLFDMYRENKKHARIFYMNGNSQVYEWQRWTLFENPDNNDFDIVESRIRVGISVTSKMYKFTKRVSTVRYREKTGFWYCYGGNIRRLNNRHVNMYGDINHKVFIKKFAWYKAITENNLSISNNLSFYKIWKNKLYSLDKMLKAYYNLPLPAAKVLYRVEKANQNNGYLSPSNTKLNTFHRYKRWLKNVENISEEMLTEHATLFFDTVKMGKVLDYVVNCSWGLKRFKTEHDKWAMEITDVIATCDNRELNVADVYLKFGEFSGYDVLRETKDLVYEGKRLAHCVATYSHNIDSGNSGIYRVGDATLELGFRNNEVMFDTAKGDVIGIVNEELYSKQMRGFANANPSDELTAEVAKAIKDFNDKHKSSKILNEWELKEVNGSETGVGSATNWVSTVDGSQGPSTGSTIVGGNIVIDRVGFGNGGFEDGPIIAQGNDGRIIQRENVAVGGRVAIDPNNFTFAENITTAANDITIQGVAYNGDGVELQNAADGEYELF